MTTDKCPHCSAEKDTNSDNWFLCDSRFAEDSGHVYRSSLCRERSARQKAEEELANVKAERDTAKQIADDLETKAICGAYAAVLLRRHCGLDDTKEDLCEVAELVVSLRADLAKAREELEAWKEMAAGLVKLVYRFSSDGNETKEVMESTRIVLRRYRDMHNGSEKGNTT